MHSRNIKIIENIFFFTLIILAPVFVMAEMSSSSYQIKADVVGSFGADSDSENYQLNDTGGEVGTGDSSSSNYDMRAGYWPMVIDYKVSLACSESVEMGAITGTGQSTLTTNYATCTVITDNPAGYSMTWSSNPESMENEQSDTISAYTPAVSETPENWTVDSSVSEWGGHLGSTSTTIDTDKWGSSDTYNSGKWVNVKTTDWEIAERSNETSLTGDTQYVYFGAEVGANKHQPSGTYDAIVTITILSL